MDSEFEHLLTAAYTRAQDLTPGTPEYTEAIAAIAKLEDMRDRRTTNEMNWEYTQAQTDAIAQKSRMPSADAILTAATSLVGIAIIVGYEHAHAVTSKALGFVLKPKS